MTACTSLLHVADPGQGGCLAILGARRATVHSDGQATTFSCQLRGPPTAAVRLAPRLLLIGDAAAGLHLLDCRSRAGAGEAVQPVHTATPIPVATTLAFVAHRTLTSAGETRTAWPAQ